MSIDQDRWAAKIALFFHDPIIKAYCQGTGNREILAALGETSVEEYADAPYLEDSAAVAREGAHGSWAQAHIGSVLHAAYTGTPRPSWWSRMADFSSSGADRPIIGNKNIAVSFWVPPGAAERRPQEHFELVTHPLCRSPLNVPRGPRSIDERRELVLLLRRTIAELGNGVVSESPKHRWLVLWRRLYARLAREDGLFWPLLPADTRCPDHSIWDHLRISAALDFIPSGTTADARRRSDRMRQARPWLLSLWVGPVAEFVYDARTARDLWTGSMILSELAWAMCEPIVERHGPDALLYPDLRFNPRADFWLRNRGVPAFERDEPPTSTRAALIPNRVVAIVPEATVIGDSVTGLVDACRRAMVDRWQSMARSVEEWLKLSPSSRARPIFHRQVHEQAPTFRWAAVPWVADVKLPVSTQFTMPPGLPYERGAEGMTAEQREREQSRERRFSPWIDSDTWRHYQFARYVWFLTHRPYLEGNRGYDYALVHHQLLSVTTARKYEGDERANVPEPGEKCSLCGVRQVLSEADSTDEVGVQRAAAREFWSNVDLDPDGRGAERLCGRCAMRRFLSESADGVLANLAMSPVVDRRRRVPFPSTGAIAMQRMLEFIATADGEVGRLRDRFVRAARAGARRTQRPDALPRLRRVLLSRPEAKEFLELDAQELLPGTWETRRARLRAGERLAGVSGEPALIEAAAAAAALLRKAASEMPRQKSHSHNVSTQSLVDESVPAACYRIAVIALDGDGIGRLLLGDPERIRATWGDVLHPYIVERIPVSERLAAWRALVNRPRLMGPSLHAFVSRALGGFAHRILPWITEREYGGRLIYAGGDDALLLCPADEAFELVARVHEVFTAPWIIDRAPSVTTWATDAGEADPIMAVTSTAARNRFAVISTGSSPHDLQAYAKECLVVPMLGANQSVSAGVSYGHMKSSLRGLIASARDALEKAKRHAAPTSSQGHAGLRWHTRGGEKLGLTIPLSARNSGGFVDDFNGTMADSRPTGRIPRRLGYKLRAQAPLVAAAIQANRRLDELLRGLVLREIERSRTRPAGSTDREEVARKVASVWRLGIANHLHLGDPMAVAARSADGVLLARALAGLGDDAGEAM